MLAALLVLITAPLPDGDAPGGPRLIPPPAILDTAGDTEWYGYQTLAVRGAGVAIAAIGVAATGADWDSPATIAFAAIGGLVFTAGPPIVHGLNGEGGHAVASLLMNLLAPSAVGGAVLYGTLSSADTLGDVVTSVEVTAGVVLGVAALTTTLDATALGFTSEPPRPTLMLTPDGSRTVGLALDW